MQGTPPPEPPKAHTCAKCQVERGFGNCPECKKVNQLRKIQGHLRVKKEAHTGRNKIVPAHEAGDKPLPYRKLFRDIGRNEPCPCGSGKKYKKCCLGEAVSPQLDARRRVREAKEKAANEPLRTVVRVNGGEEEVIRMQELRRGDRFRLEGDPKDHVDPAQVFVADSDGYQNEHGVWCVDGHPLEASQVTSADA